jgi:hypothetical protein
VDRQNRPHRVGRRVDRQNRPHRVDRQVDRQNRPHRVGRRVGRQNRRARLVDHRTRLALREDLQSRLGRPQLFLASVLVTSSCNYRKSTLRWEGSRQAAGKVHDKTQRQARDFGSWIDAVRPSGSSSGCHSQSKFVLLATAEEQAQHRRYVAPPAAPEVATLQAMGQLRGEAIGDAVALLAFAIAVGGKAHVLEKLSAQVNPIGQSARLGMRNQQKPLVDLCLNFQLKLGCRQFTPCPIRQDQKMAHSFHHLAQEIAIKSLGLKRSTRQFHTQLHSPLLALPHEDALPSLVIHRPNERDDVGHTIELVVGHQRALDLTREPQLTPLPKTVGQSP